MREEPVWREYPHRVLAARPVTPVIRELLLGPDGAALPFAAGQYALLDDPGHRVPQRSYSLAAAPRPDGVVSLLVTLVPGGVTSAWAHGLRDGDGVVLSGPYGVFAPDPGRTGPVLLLAAGSGLAPARAIAEDLLGGYPSRRVALLFSARTRADAIDDARFRAWARAREGFRYLLTLTREPDAPERRHIPDLLADAMGDLGGWEVLASGAPGFVADCASAARALGAAPGAVRTEEFFAEPQPVAR